MPISSLQNIIRVENELLAKEQAEEKKIEGWLQVKEKEIIAEYTVKRNKLADRRKEVKNHADMEAEKRALEILRAAENKASRLAGIADEDLSAVVQKHLPTIISGNFS